MTPDDVKELVSQCPALDEKMRATGKVLVSTSLGYGQLDDASPAQRQDARQRWALHRVQGSGRRLSIIEADSRDEGLRIASMHPAATLGEEGGWTIELIPVASYLAQ